jgi:hypothetical protein
VESLRTNLIVNTKTRGSSVLKHANSMKNVGGLAESAAGVNHQGDLDCIRDPSGGLRQFVQANPWFNLTRNHAQPRAGQIDATEPYRLGDSRRERVVNPG